MILSFFKIAYHHVSCKFIIGNAGLMYLVLWAGLWGWLAPLFRHPRAWQILDAAVGGLMWLRAATLILNSIGK